MYGEWPNHEIDHINGDSLDNRICNLRDVTSQGNNRNMSLAKTNTSGVCGVRYKKDRSKWVALITLNNRQTHLGYYQDFFEAVCARKSAERKYGFHENHGRQKND
jgi:hypothetical protein